MMVMVMKTGSVDNGGGGDSWFDDGDDIPIKAPLCNKRLYYPEKGVLIVISVPRKINLWKISTF